MRTVGSSECDIISTIPLTTSPRGRFSGFRSCRRAKASMRFVRAAPLDRQPPSPAPASRVSRSSPSTRLRASSRLDITTMRRLLKSCAKPPVSCPRLSSFCISAILRQSLLALARTGFDFSFPAPRSPPQARPSDRPRAAPVRRSGSRAAGSFGKRSQKTRTFARSSAGHDRDRQIVDRASLIAAQAVDFGQVVPRRRR